MHFELKTIFKSLRCCDIEINKVFIEIEPLDIFILTSLSSKITTTLQWAYPNSVACLQRILRKYCCTKGGITVALENCVSI